MLVNKYPEIKNTSNYLKEYTSLPNKMFTTLNDLLLNYTLPCWHADRRQGLQSSDSGSLDRLQPMPWHHNDWTLVDYPHWWWQCPETQRTVLHPPKLTGCPKSIEVISTSNTSWLMMTIWYYLAFNTFHLTILVFDPSGSNPYE